MVLSEKKLRLLIKSLLKEVDEPKDNTKEMSPDEAIKKIQLVVGTKDDGKWGRKTNAAYDEWIAKEENLKLFTGENAIYINTAKASKNPVKVAGLMPDAGNSSGGDKGGTKVSGSKNLKQFVNKAVRVATEAGSSQLKNAKDAMPTGENKQYLYLTDIMTAWPSVKFKNSINKKDTAAGKEVSEIDVSELGNMDIVANIVKQQYEDSYNSIFRDQVAKARSKILNTSDFADDFGNYSAEDKFYLLPITINKFDSPKHIGSFKIIIVTPMKEK